MDSNSIDTRTLVRQTADQLLAEGIKPTVANVRERTQRGSAGTINEALKSWWQELSEKIRQPSSDIPEAIQIATQKIWQSATQLAKEQLEEFRQQAQQQIDHAIEKMQQAQTAQEQLQKDQQQLLETNAALQQANQALQKQLESEESQHQLAMKNWAQSREKNTELQNSLQHAREESAEKQKELQQKHQKEIAQRETEQNALLEKNHQLILKSALLEEKKQQNQQKLDEMQQRFELQLSQQNNLLQHSQKLQESLSLSEARLDSERQQRQDLHTQQQKSQSTYDALLLQFEQQSTQLNAKTAENRFLQNLLDHVSSPKSGVS
ncbi:MAG: DNA-binding protein [Gammaproteobacteria bacterium]|nr:DNA-binding protein [Gammaproteobacteria bacterium]